MPFWRLRLLRLGMEAEPPRLHFQAKPGNEIVPCPNLYDYSYMAITTQKLGKA